MLMYIAQAVNLDVPSDGRNIINYYMNKTSAINACRGYVIDKHGSHAVEDIEGNLKEVFDESLKYERSEGKPAIYYRSYYGSYRCVAFVETIDVIEG
jgi:hypothetical protein